VRTCAVVIPSYEMIDFFSQIASTFDCLPRTWPATLPEQIEEDADGVAK
jgi:hypothetical protein